MLYPIKNIEELENLSELVSSEKQVKAVRLQHKLGKQIFHENIKKSLNQLLIQLKKPLKR